MYFSPRTKNVLPHSTTSRQGVVLVAVLLVLVILTLAALQYSSWMLAERKAADSYARSAQALALADSGIQYASAALSSPDSFANLLKGNPYDNSQAFQGIEVSPESQGRGRGLFSIVATIDSDDPMSGQQSYRFGVVDEAGKINLNALFKLDSSGKIAHDMLMKLPNMDESLVNSILDWIDVDSESRSGGAEDEYYTPQVPSYHCKNGPLDSLEELLLVKGMTPEILFGNDRNRNGILDPDEDDGTGVLDRGLSANLTVYSREQNVNSQNLPRIFLNQGDLKQLATSLQDIVSDDVSKYIVAYRIYGPGSSQSTSSGQSGSGGSSQGSGQGGGGQNGQGGGGQKGTGGGGQNGSGGGKPQGNGQQTTGTLAFSANGGSFQLKVDTGGSQSNTKTPAIGNIADLQVDTTQKAKRKIASIYELVNSYISIPGKKPEDRATIYYSPLNDKSDKSTLAQLLPLLLDNVTTTQDMDLPARINVNTAPRSVLATLPSITDSDISAILSNRPSTSATEAPDPIYQSSAWLLTNAGFTADKLRTLERYVTARSQVYRIQALGYFDGRGPTARVEAVVDTNGGRPRIIYWRNLTELGKGFDLQK